METLDQYHGWHIVVRREFSEGLAEGSGFLEWGLSEGACRRCFRALSEIGRVPYCNKLVFLCGKYALQRRTSFETTFPLECVVFFLQLRSFYLR